MPREPVGAPSASPVLALVFLVIEVVLGVQIAHLMQHSLFRLWIRLDATAMEQLCGRAVSLMRLRPKDDLFHAGALAHEAYSVAQGTLVYTAKRLQVSTSGDIKETASEGCTGCWICEAVLRGQWVHVVRLDALTE